MLQKILVQGICSGSLSFDLSGNLKIFTYFYVSPYIFYHNVSQEFSQKTLEKLSHFYVGIQLQYSTSHYTQFRSEMIKEKFFGLHFHLPCIYNCNPFIFT